MTWWIYVQNTDIVDLQRYWSKKSRCKDQFQMQKRQEAVSKDDDSINRFVLNIIEKEKATDFDN